MAHLLAVVEQIATHNLPIMTALTSDQIHALTTEQIAALFSTAIRSNAS